MFGFKKKTCAVCGARNVINVGRPIGYLCEKHLLETYTARFLDHSGRKIIIPPTVPDKYTSYVYESVASLRSYGLEESDIEPVERRFSELAKPECYVMQTSYKTRDFFDIDFLETAKGSRQTRAHAVTSIISALSPYMKANGIDLPPEGDEDIILYPLRS